MSSYTDVYDTFFHADPPVDRRTFYASTTYLSLALIGIVTIAVWPHWYWLASACIVAVGISVFCLPGPRWVCTSIFDQEAIVRWPWVAAVTWPIWIALFFIALFFIDIMSDDD